MKRRTEIAFVAFGWVPLTAMGLFASVAGAGTATTGVLWTDPSGIVLGPNDNALPGARIWVGGNAIGTLTIDAGSSLLTGFLSFGAGGAGHGTGAISGNGTRVLIDGGAFNQRLIVGDWGVGQLTVSAGATLDTRGNQASCLIPFRFCDSFVGGAAGDMAVLSIAGAGTQALFGQTFFVAQPGLAVRTVDGYDYGNPGGTTRGTVNVTDGALLRTDRAQVAPRHWSTSATGRERNIGEVNVIGAGSRWEIVGGQVVDNVSGNVFQDDASILTANDPNAWARINVTGGGTLEIQGVSGLQNGISLTSNGGRTDMLVSGQGSLVNFAGDGTFFNIGRRNGSAFVRVEAGARVAGVWATNVGRDGSFAELVLDGAGTLYSSTGGASAAAAGTAQNATMSIGRNGTGVVTVQNGARLEIMATGIHQSAPSIHLGRDPASSGTLNIRGAGSVVELSAVSIVPGGGPNEASQPFVRVGRHGSGTLNITEGGKLVLNGGAVSTPDTTRTTSLYIGGTSDTEAGGHGIALVSGAGSQIQLLGNSPAVSVGRGPGATGQLTIREQGSLTAGAMSIGRAGGVGVVTLNDARIDLSGTVDNIESRVVGARVRVGLGGGIGNLRLSNNSQLTITTPEGLGGAVYIGGGDGLPLGEGSLTLEGGSRLRIASPAGLAHMSVGYDGSGFARVKEASAIDLGDGALYVGRLAGSDGTLIVTDASTISAGYVGVGRTATADGGTATLIINSGSTLTANRIEIGPNGYLGGTGTITGAVINYGVLSPGNSPGTLVIDGSFINALGGRLLLEVGADGNGGFVTDRLIFRDGASVDLDGLNVTFRFLGNVDPNAFQASGKFDIDTFFALRTATGDVDLDHAAFDAVSFDARADAFHMRNFAFDVESGASFVASPVPEPRAYLLLVAGVALIAARRSRTKIPRTAALSE